VRPTGPGTGSHQVLIADGDAAGGIGGCSRAASDGARVRPVLWRRLCLRDGLDPLRGAGAGPILGLASTQSGVAEATALLTVYAAGFSLPFLAAGAFFGAPRRAFQRVNPHLDTISYISGALLIVVGLLVFTDSLVNLNLFFSFAQVNQVGGSAGLGLAGFIIAFVAGVVSVASPCVLPMVPVYMLYITGFSVGADGRLESTESPFLHAGAFVLGFRVVFIILGASVGLIGTVLRDDIFTRAAGALRTSPTFEAGPSS
jgi:cytochrome c biogenesis protein CcdA